MSSARSLVLRRVGDREEQRDGHVLADDGGRLEQPLVVGRQAVDAGGQDGLDRGGDLGWLGGPGRDGRRRARRPGPRVSTRVRTLSSRKRGFAFRALDQELLERAEGRVAPRSASSSSSALLGRQRVDPELGVVGLAAPGMLVLGAVADEEQEARRGHAVDEAVEQAPASRASIQWRSSKTTTSGCTWLSRSRRRLTASSVCWRRWGGSSACHGRLVHRHVEQRQERRAGWARAPDRASGPCP